MSRAQRNERARFRVKKRQFPPATSAIDSRVQIAHGGFYHSLFFERKSIAKAAFQSLVDPRVRRRLFPRMYVWSDSAFSHFRGACAPAMKMAKTLISTC